MPYWCGSFLLAAVFLFSPVLPPPRPAFLWSRDEETAAQKLEQEPGYTRTTRWRIPPQGHQQLLVKFCVDNKKSGVWDADLTLQIVGDPQPFTIEARAVCGLPKISVNPRHLFREVIRQRPNHSHPSLATLTDGGAGSVGAIVRKQYILAEVRSTYKRRRKKRDGPSV